MAEIITWNPNDKGDSIILSNNNLTAEVAGVTSSVRSTRYVDSGKWYFEITIDKNNEVWNRSTVSIGVCNKTDTLPNNSDTGKYIAYNGAGLIKYIESYAYGEIYGLGDTIGIAFDCDAKIMMFSKNGNWFSTIDLPIWNEYNPILLQSASQGSNIVTVNFGKTFKYEVPDEFKPYQSTISKYLIKLNNEYYTVKPENYQNSQFIPLGITSPTAEDYKTYGFDYVNALCTNMAVEGKTFKPIDKIIGNFELLRYQRK